MDSPFYSWFEQENNPRRAFKPSSSFRGGVPVYPVDSTYDSRRPSRQTRPQKPGPKVVQIPVHFVGSEPKDRSGSASKIQKVFRGFLVRKSMKKIRDIKAQVDEIEGKLSRGEVVELIQRDSRERLRVNETLMALLFKLDSIRGIDSGVRDCRKAVIRRAIALQERVDFIAASNLKENIGGDVEGIDEEKEVRVSVETDASIQSGNPPIDSDNCVQIAGEVDGCVEASKILEGSVEGLEDVNSIQEEIDPNMEFEGNDEGEIGIIDVGVDREVKVVETDCNEKAFCNCKNLDDQNLGNLKRSLSENDEKEKIGSDWVEVEEDEKAKKKKDEDDSRRNSELMDKLIKDNEKLMGLMMQMSERNETQARMLNALTHRVELLEKAFVCDRLRKKKKKKKAAPCRED